MVPLSLVRDDAIYIGSEFELQTPHLGEFLTTKLFGKKIQ